METNFKPLVYTIAPCNAIGVPQPTMVGEKFVIEIDEKKYSEAVIIPGLREAYPEADETRILRLAQLESDIIAIFFETSFVEQQFKNRSYNWLLEKLKEFERLDNTISDTDISETFNRNLQNGRIKRNKFPDGHIKFQYDAFHREKLIPIETQVFKKLPDGKNPFKKELSSGIC